MGVRKLEGVSNRAKLKGLSSQEKNDISEASHEKTAPDRSEAIAPNMDSLTMRVGLPP